MWICGRPHWETPNQTTDSSVGQNTSEAHEPGRRETHVPDHSHSHIFCSRLQDNGPMGLCHRAVRTFPQLRSASLLPPFSSTQSPLCMSSCASHTHPSVSVSLYAQIHTHTHTHTHTVTYGYTLLWNLSWALLYNIFMLIFLSPDSYSCSRCDRGLSC